MSDVGVPSHVSGVSPEGDGLADVVAIGQRAPEPGTFTLTVKRAKGDREPLGTAVVEIGVSHDAVFDVTVEAE